MTDTPSAQQGRPAWPLRILRRALRAVGYGEAAKPVPDRDLSLVISAAQMIEDLYQAKRIRQSRKSAGMPARQEGITMLKRLKEALSRISDLWTRKRNAVEARAEANAKNLEDELQQEIHGALGHVADHLESLEGRLAAVEENLGIGAPTEAPAADPSAQDQEQKEGGA